MSKGPRLRRTPHVTRVHGTVDRLCAVPEMPPTRAAPLTGIARTAAVPLGHADEWACVGISQESVAFASLYGNMLYFLHKETHDYLA